MNVDESDVYEALFRLHEAKGSIDVLTDLGDSNLCSVLLEDSKRIREAIEILLDMIKQNRKNEIRERIFAASSQSLEEEKSG